jgi:hypothetical protein
MLLVWTVVHIPIKYVINPIVKATIQNFNSEPPLSNKILCPNLHQNHVLPPQKKNFTGNPAPNG